MKTLFSLLPLLLAASIAAEPPPPPIDIKLEGLAAQTAIRITWTYPSCAAGAVEAWNILRSTNSFTPDPTGFKRELAQDKDYTLSPQRPILSLDSGHLQTLTLTWVDTNIVKGVIYHYAVSAQTLESVSKPGPTLSCYLVGDPGK